MLLDPNGVLAADGFAERIDHVAAPCANLGATAVLLRPDGHVAWAGADRTGLEDALARWFGPAV
ncbi:hypothetical protein [Granulicoccus phenolivorans]|uniref:aromatic-ring hydroxylase C-terminal domain-containing protein n=1 Tax=Granulicoccus phenolivorans TaxID=266854 RepID=UPI0031F63DBD